jgi:hypothetical protein
MNYDLLKSRVESVSTACTLIESHLLPEDEAERAPDGAKIAEVSVLDECSQCVFTTTYLRSRGPDRSSILFGWKEPITVTPRKPINFLTFISTLGDSN